MIQLVLLYWKLHRSKMDRLTLALAISCGILLVIVAYLSLTVAQQREQMLCGNRAIHAPPECS